MALHEVQLKGYSVRPGNLSLGTYDSYGIEQLHVTLDDTWSGLAIDATFHNTPNDKGVTMLVDTDGLVTVPPEACMRASKYATITFRGVQDGVQRISCNLPYMVLDHAQVPGANSTATPSENAQALAQMQDLRDGAVDAKNQAESARDAAARSAVAAKESETNAGQSATAAKTAQSAAETAKAGAETAQKAAASSASSASTSASTATTQAAAAKSSATTAKASEAAAGKSAKEAAASAANLDSAVNTATQKAAAASASAEAAKASESAAASSEAAARKYANSAELAAKTAGEAAAEKLQQMQAIQDDVTAKQAQTATDATAAEKAKVAAEAAQKGATASETAAADSAAAAKTSEDAAAKSAADANSTANSINNSMMQIAALQKRQNVLVGSETGNPVSCNDAYSAPLCGLTVYGKSTQDGTPSPDNPVPIVSAGDDGSIAVKVTGTNMVEGTKLGNRGNVSGVSYTANKDGISFVGKADTALNIYLHNDIKEKLTPGVYYLTVKGLSASVSINFYQVGSFNNDVQNKEVRIVAGKEYTILLRIEKGTAVNALVVQVSLTRSKITTYSPYREQLLTLPTPNGLPGIPVTSGGNYTDQNGQQWVCDEVDLERGVKVQRVNIVDLSTCKISGVTELAVTRRLTIILPIRGRDYTTKALCNKLQLITSFDKDVPHFYVNNTNVFIFIPIDAKNPEEGEYILFYALATPIETPLTPAEIAAYKALTAYAPDTVVQASDGAGIKLDYQRDVNLVVKNLEDAIASMTTT
mgnify:CR=1 FL=1|jgi:hypothetical protein|nr:MAG TPA: hypothetical protein [Caudoviricetes sp.]